MSTLDLVNYYKNLLEIQYNGLPKASATIETAVRPIVMPQTSVQQISFAIAPTSGTFVLSWAGTSTPAINWNDTATTIQGYLQAIPGLGSVTVTGSIAAKLLVVTFVDVLPPAALLVVASSTLNNGAPTIAETDETIPIAIQNAFNLLGDNIAAGVNLDVLGKYAGVTRSGRGFSTNITLNDADFLSLIRMAIIVNTMYSSLENIQKLIAQFFPGEMLVFDYQDMKMSYLISSSIGSQDLVQLFITENILPKPMGVAIYYIIYAPTINNFFGFGTYETPAYNVSPFNTYSSYNMNSPWLSYADAFPVV